MDAPKDNNYDQHLGSHYSKNFDAFGGSTLSPPAPLQTNHLSKRGDLLLAKRIEVFKDSNSAQYLDSKSYEGLGQLTSLQSAAVKTNNLSKRGDLLLANRIKVFKDSYPAQYLDSKSYGSLGQLTSSQAAVKTRRLSKRSSASPPKPIEASKDSSLRLVTQQPPSPSPTHAQPHVQGQLVEFGTVVEELGISIEETAAPELEPSTLDMVYHSEEEFWNIITFTYNQVCRTRCEGSSGLHRDRPGLCSMCWCDQACLLYGDCCPDYYKHNGYVPPLYADVQGCRSAALPPTSGPQHDYYRFVWACADRQSIQYLRDFSSKLKDEKDRNSFNDSTDDTRNDNDDDVNVDDNDNNYHGVNTSEAQRMCMNPDPTSHWNQTQPITDLDSGLTFSNQYCAQCSGISLKNYLPWHLSINMASSEFFSQGRTVLETYMDAVTSSDAQVVYTPPKTRDSQVRRCRNYKDVSTLTNHITRCNQTGLWGKFSLIAQEACGMLDLPISPLGTRYSYKNPYCYYCNHDVTWEQVKSLRAASPSIIPGTGHTLEVLMDLDGSEDVKVQATPELVVPGLERRCNSSQYYDALKDKCLKTTCAPGKLRGADNSCRSNPHLRSNAFGYTACYLVGGLPEGPGAVTDLAARLAQQPDLVKLFDLDSLDSNNTAGEEEVDQTPLRDFLKATIVKTSSWTCNSCGLLGKDPDTATLLVQVAWASQGVLDSNRTERLLMEARAPLLDLLATTVSAVPGSKFYVGNLTVVKYPYCRVEENPVPSVSFKRFLPLPRHIGQTIAPAPCGDNLDAANQTECALDAAPRVTIPPGVYSWGGYVKEYVNLVKYLPVNKLLACQFVEVSREEYSFNIQTWTVRLNHCESDIPAGDVTIAETDGAMYVCLSDYACWADNQTTQYIQNTQSTQTIHNVILSWISLVCTILSMLCCVVTFLTYICLPAMRSSAGINNMILVATDFFAQGLVEFSGTQAGRHTLCLFLAVLTHFFWLAAVAAMSTATFHMFFALSFPLRFQQYHGRERVLLRVYASIVLLTPSVIVAATIAYGLVEKGRYVYAGGSHCFVDAGLPKIIFFGVPIFICIMGNIGMYTFTVTRLQGTPNIGETKIQRNYFVLYSKLSVATGVFWLFGYVYELTKVVVFAYAFMLTAPLLGLFLLLAFVANRRVLDMAREQYPSVCVKLIPPRANSFSSNTPKSSSSACKTNHTETKTNSTETKTNSTKTKTNSAETKSNSTETKTKSTTAE
ncbi:hypothetical protein EGW08_016720 [Elysia chlorotica]|uniref:SMB domain-containing protein n=1 Tax=Elysia chlorotica TaxID=188477 RepID=A0A433T1T8_ELYCH|nr:hypothetical protein EGW08_016720 [Elysia chlorotica]